MRGLLIIVILFLAGPAVAMKGYNECGAFKQKIRETVHTLQLDELAYSEENYHGLTFQFDINQAFKINEEGISRGTLQRTRQGNVLVESIYPELYFQHREIKPLDEVQKINGINSSTLTDEQIFTFLEKDQITIEIIEKDKKNRIYTLNKSKSDVGWVLINFEIREIDSIDSALSRYKVGFLHTLVWSNRKFLPLAQDIHRQGLKANKSNNQYLGFICNFSEKEFEELNVYEPKMVIANRVSFEGNATSINYVIEFIKDLENDENDFIELRKIIDGIGTFKADFDFRSFPFDSQEIKFEFRSDENENYILMPYLNEYSHLLFKRGYDDLDMSEWQKAGIDYEYFYIKDILYDSYQTGFAYKIKIERNYLYYLSKIFLPIIIILLVSLSVFWIRPTDLEGRLTVSVVCLLALIAYTFIVDKDLPKLSYLTIMDYAVLLSYFFSSIPTLQSIYVNRVSDENLERALRVDRQFRIMIPIIYLFSFILMTASIIISSPNTVAAFKM